MQLKRGGKNLCRSAAGEAGRDVASEVGSVTGQDFNLALDWPTTPKSSPLPDIGGAAGKDSAWALQMDAACEIRCRYVQRTEQSRKFLSSASSRSRGGSPSPIERTSPATRHVSRPGDCNRAS
jgi:hypothetical protein